MKELTTPEAFEILLRRLNACEDAVAWARGKTFREAWLTCERGDWMFWLAARAGVDLKTVVLAACACARLSLKYVKVGEDRPRIAIETAERWARGEATSDEVRAAAAAAYAAYAADAAAYAAYAAYAAADADDAAYAACAAYAAYAAYAADADYADADYARKSTLKECAEIVRRMIPDPEAKK